MARPVLPFRSLLSFNELVWILVFGLATLFALQSTTAEQLRHQLSESLEQQNRLTQELSKANSELSSVRQKSINQQLVGLRGRLHRVVVIVDRSGSMKYGRKWEYTQSIIKLGCNICRSMSVL